MDTPPILGFGTYLVLDIKVKERTIHTAHTYNSYAKWHFVFERARSPYIVLAQCTLTAFKSLLLLSKDFQENNEIGTQKGTMVIPLRVVF